MEPAGAMPASVSQSPTITTPAMTQAGHDSRHGGVHVAGAGARARPSTSAPTSGPSACVLYEMLTGSGPSPATTCRTRSRVLRDGAGLGRASGARPAARPSGCFARACRRIRSSALRDIGGRAPGAGGRVRDGRAAEGRDSRHRRHADGWPGWRRSPPQSSRPPRSPFPRCGICARHRHRAARDAHRDRHARHRPVPRRLRSRPTAARSSSWPRVTARRVCGCGRWQRRRRSRWRAPRGPTLPFWSPDGRSIGFFAGGALKRLDLGGGAPQTLAPAINGARRDVERGRRHRVCAERARPP